MIKGSYKFYIRESIKDAIDNNMKNVPFKVNKIVESYNGKEGIVVEEEKDKVLVSITKQFPTPNFAMAVERIVGNKGQYEIHIITAPPKKNIQIQVIKYKTIYLEIDKDIGNLHVFKLYCKFSSSQAYYPLIPLVRVFYCINCNN